MKVQSLHIYPLKSGRGVEIEQAEITTWGLAGDRRYMITERDGKFITQRDLQSLAQVSALADGDALVLSKAGEDETLRVAFDPAKRLDVEVWGSFFSASTASPQVDAVLSNWFGRPVRIVHADPDSHRACSPEWAGEGVETGFADGFPILVTTTGSLDALARAAETTGGAGFGMDRFRPNIVVDDAAPFADDQWSAIEINGVRYDFVKPCARCIMTTQDQMTGERGGPDPMPAMRQIRMSADRTVPGVLFGWNAVPRADGQVKIGDSVKVVAARPEGWPLRQR